MNGLRSIGSSDAAQHPISFLTTTNTLGHGALSSALQRGRDLPTDRDQVNRPRLCRARDCRPARSCLFGSTKNRHASRDRRPQYALCIRRRIRADRWRMGRRRGVDAPPALARERRQARPPPSVRRATRQAAEGDHDHWSRRGARCRECRAVQAGGSRCRGECFPTLFCAIAAAGFRL